MLQDELWIRQREKPSPNRRSRIFENQTVETEFLIFEFWGRFGSVPFLENQYPIFSSGSAHPYYLYLSVCLFVSMSVLTGQNCWGVARLRSNCSIVWIVTYICSNERPWSVLVGSRQQWSALLLNLIHHLHCWLFRSQCCCYISLLVLMTQSRNLHKNLVKVDLHKKLARLT